MPTLGARAYVDPAATVIGDVVLGEDASIWPGAVLRGDVHYIRIGARSNVQDGAVVHVTHDGPYSPGGFPTIVGEGVTIGHAAVIHACTIEDSSARAAWYRPARWWASASYGSAIRPSACDCSLISKSSNCITQPIITCA